MKNFQKILTVATAITIATMATQPLQAQDNSLPKQEFTVNVFGGLSTLNYKIDGAKLKNGIGGGLGFGYHYFFNPQWGIVTGIEAALYRASLSADMFLSAQYYNPDGADDHFIMEHDLNGFKEEQNLWALQLPIMVQWMQPLGSSANNYFYAALGGRLSYALSGNFRQSTQSVEQYIVDQWNPVGEYTGRLAGYDRKETLKFSAFNAMASAEMGIRWKLSDKMSLYTGIYFDYGLLNIIPEKSKEALYALKDGGEGHPSEYEQFTANSVLSAHSPHYGIFTTGQQPHFVHNTAGYTDKVNTMAAGIKIKLAFGGKKKLPPMPDEPKPVVKPEPKPLPEPKPVQEVPQEIKQSMIRLSNTLFEFDRFNLTNEAVVELDKVVKWLKDNPALKVEIEGHTDNVGTAEYNQRLSEDRAKSVYNYFVEHGVLASQLSYRGYGLTRPIAENTTAAGRQENRRVELRIME